MIESPFFSTAQFPTYLNVPQGATVRIDSNLAKDIEGICTHGIGSCLVIIMQGNNGKLSLTHTDLAVKAAALADECTWAGTNCKMIVARNPYWYGSDPKLSKLWVFDNLFWPQITAVFAARNLQPAIEFTTMIAGTGVALAITRTGKITKLSDNILGKPSPDHKLRYTIIQLNGYTAKYHGLDVIFDNNDWTATTALSANAQSLVDSCKSLPLTGDMEKDKNTLVKYIYNELVKTGQHEGLARIYSDFIKDGNPKGFLDNLKLAAQRIIEYNKLTTANTTSMQPII